MPAKKTYVIAMAALLCAPLAAPLAVADNFRPQTRTATQIEIAERLDRFESAAAALQKQTDHYAASARNNTLHAQSHAYELNSAREQVNTLGRELSKLEELSPQGTELQQAAIREAKPELQAVADHVQSAIVMLNEDRRSRGTPAFKENVKGMNESANNLYSKVDAITDYEKAGVRAGTINAPAEPEA
jgi:hypothetical protein